MVAVVELCGTIFLRHNTCFVLPECPQIHYISNQDRFPDGRRYTPGEGWHTGHLNDICPPKATLLHAIQLPGSGGDTQFANVAIAYEALPDKLKTRIAPLIGIHVYQGTHSARQLMHLSKANKERVPNAVRHPIVRTHPETERRSTSTRSGSKAFSSSTIEEALPLLDELLEHATAGTFQYRHKWQTGDLAMWDNRRL